MEYTYIYKTLLPVIDLAKNGLNVFTSGNNFIFKIFFCSAEFKFSISRLKSLGESVLSDVVTGVLKEVKRLDPCFSEYKVDKSLPSSCDLPEPFEGKLGRPENPTAGPGEVVKAGLGEPPFGESTP
jgi:hypothetical protein